MKPARPTPVMAFTLLEVLLATAIAAVVLIAVQAVFASALQLRSRTQAALDTSLPVERALELVRRDLLSLAPPGGTLSGALQTAPTNGALLTGQVGPQFVTATGLLHDNEPWPTWQRVSYSLQRPTNNTPGQQWFRHTSRNLLATSTELPSTEWLLDGVEDLRFGFHDGTQWRDTWDSTVDTPATPVAIKVTLQLAPPDRNSELPPPIEIFVPLLVTSPTVQTNLTAASGGTQPPP